MLYNENLIMFCLCVGTMTVFGVLISVALGLSLEGQESIASDFASVSEI
ncbi:hypothetical protein IHQ71_30265 (plasmid) [Rhizobium sp. TH2]|nr:hypothetical protein IHQ71_30265 [Rhizobium sp. TH2]